MRRRCRHQDRTGLLGHSNPQLTLGHYARAVVSMGESATEAMAERFLPWPRDERAIESDSDEAG